MSATVELMIDGDWLDITRLDDQTYVCSEVTITRGRTDSQSLVAPTDVTFDYLDPNAVLDTENPHSDYYRKIAVPGTEMRIKKDGEVRAHVTLDSMTPFWEDGNENVIVAVRGVGIFDEYESTDGEQPVGSPAFRAYTSMENDAERVAYWSLEEEEGAVRVLSPYSDVQPGSTFPELTFGGFTGSVTSARMVTFGDLGRIVLTVPDYTSAEHKVVTSWHYPSSALDSDTVLARVGFTGGNTTHMDIVNNIGGTGAETFRVVSYNGFTALDNTPTLTIDDVDNVLGGEFILSLEVETVGSDLEVTLLFAGVGNNGQLVSDTFSSDSVGRVNAIVLNPFGNATGVSVAHAIVGSSTTAFPNFISPTNGTLGSQGYLGECAAQRADRLAAEEGLELHVIGNDNLSEPMGVQQNKSFFELLRDSEAADLGVLFEERDGNHFVYRTRTSFYNQPATATLSYQHIMPGFRPTRDAKSVANDVTATRTDGTPARYAVPDGDFWHYTTEDPPEGMRSRKTSVQAEVETDGQLNEIAAWVAHMRSWREKHYPSVTIEVSRDSVTDDDETMILALDIGDVMELDTTGAPRWVSYDPVRFIVEGYTEILGEFLHTITFNTTPADIYEVDIVTSGPTSVLAAPIDDDDTTLKIAPGDGPEWSTTDESYHIQVGGEPMTVLGITTDTPAFIAAGTASHADNASVTPGLPAGMTPDVGQLMIMVAAIRNSGTGTVDTPSGWTVLAQTSPQRNVTVFGKYYVTGDTAPTVTFTAGASGASTSARIAGFSNVSMKLDYTAQGQLNSSAANVAYPAMPAQSSNSSVGVRRTNNLMLIAAWKQDDTTGVTAATGFTEAFEASTTLGDDQSIALDYRLDTTPTAVTAGSKTWGGGGAAASRAFVLALRPLQEAVVTRGIASTPGSVALGAEVDAWRPGVNGL